jgi:hypothetical protein
MLFIVEKTDSRRILVFTAIASIIMSKLWLPVNQGPFKEIPTVYPDQYLFMNMGPWIIRTTYLLQLGGMIILSVIFMLLIYKKKLSVVSQEIDRS